MTALSTPRGLVLALAVGSFLPATAQAQSGLLTRAQELPTITLSSGSPLAEAPFELETGKHYKLVIEADGSAELAVHGADFFRNVWINEIVINDIEVRPLGVDSLEFDAAGAAEITFITIRPGTFTLRVPGTTSEAQSATFNVIDPMFASGAAPGAPPGADAANAEEEEEEGN